MKRFLVLLAAVLIISPAFVTEAAAQSPSGREGMLVESVTVTGTGRSVVTPDRFTFNVGVQTVAGNVDDAVAENNRRIASVIAALKKAGAADADLQTSAFSIWPQQEYHEGTLPRILGYQVSNQITVRSKKVADAGRLLGVAIGAGVNTSSGINFEVSDPTRGREQGLRSAIEDARAKATLLASAAGRALGRVLVITEGVQAQPPMPLQRAMMMEAKAADVPVEAGTEEQTYTVTVTFALM